MTDPQPSRSTGSYGDKTLEKLQRELEAAEARFNGIVEIAADAIISTDDSQLIIFFNEGAEAIFGYTAAEVTGRPINDLLPERFRSAHGGYVAEFGAGQDRARRMGHRRAISGLRKNGEEFPAEAAISKHSVAGSTIYNVVLRDITDQKLASDRLAELYEEAKDAVLARDQTLAVVSHDLRNPVNAIKMLAHALVRSSLQEGAGRVPRIVADSAEIIRRAAEQADRLIQDLLDVSRIESGSLRMDTRLEDLASLIESAREVLMPLAAERSVTLTSDVASGLPPVPVDAARIHQVISNLAGNAIKFTPAGGRVAVSVEKRANEVIVSVRDTGPGMPHDQIERLTDRRWQAGRKTSGGSGLGLVIAKGIVEAHRGRLWAEPADGGGSVFRFSLPIQDEGAAA